MLHEKFLKNSLLMLLLSVGVPASSFTLHGANESGPYLAIGGGQDMFSQTISGVTKQAPFYEWAKGQGHVYPTSLIHQSAESQMSNAFGQLTAGYGFTLSSHYYIAAELAYNYLSGDKQLSTKDGKVFIPTYVRHSSYVQQKSSFAVSANNQIGINVLLGRTVFKGVLAYIKLGYADLFTKIDANIDATVLCQGEHENININRTFHNVMTATLFGLGFRVPISRHFKLAAEYDYVNFGSEEFAGHYSYRWKGLHLTRVNVDFSGKIRRSGDNRVSTSLVYVF